MAYNKAGATKMGVGFAYFNPDKHQFFDSGLFQWNSRFKALGRGPGGRALGILLSDFGSWRGDRIMALGDSSDDYATLTTAFDDVTIEAELMLIDFDGFEWVQERLADNILPFLRMCDYAIYFRREDITRLLDETFGRGKWQRRYADHLKNNSHSSAQQVIDAANRDLHRLYHRLPGQ